MGNIPGNAGGLVRFCPSHHRQADRPDNVVFYRGGVFLHPQHMEIRGQTVYICADISLRVQFRVRHTVPSVLNGQLLQPDGRNVVARMGGRADCDFQERENPSVGKVPCDSRNMRDNVSVRLVVHRGHVSVLFVSAPRKLQGSGDRYRPLDADVCRSLFLLPG